MRRIIPNFLFFFLNDPAPPEIYPLPLPAALPLFGEPAGRPAAPRQLAVQDRKPAGDGGSTRKGCSAAPDRMPLEDFFEGRHDNCIFIQYYRRRRSEEHTSELQSQSNLVCRLLLET